MKLFYLGVGVQAIVYGILSLLWGDLHPSGQIILGIVFLGIAYFVKDIDRG